MNLRMALLTILLIPDILFGASKNSWIKKESNLKLNLSTGIYKFPVQGVNTTSFLGRLSSLEIRFQTSHGRFSSLFNLNFANWTIASCSRGLDSILERDLNCESNLLSRWLEIMTLKWQIPKMGELSIEKEKNISYLLVSPFIQLGNNLNFKNRSKWTINLSRRFGRNLKLGLRVGRFLLGKSKYQKKEWNSFKGISSEIIFIPGIIVFANYFYQKNLLASPEFNSILQTNIINNTSKFEERIYSIGLFFNGNFKYLYGLFGGFGYQERRVDDLDELNSELESGRYQFKKSISFKEFMSEDCGVGNKCFVKNKLFNFNLTYFILSKYYLNLGFEKLWLDTNDLVLFSKNRGQAVKAAKTLGVGIKISESEYLSVEGQTIKVDTQVSRFLYRGRNNSADIFLLRWRKELYKKIL